MFDTPSPAEITQHFKAMTDSVTLINNTIADDSEALRNFGDASEVNLMITRNTDHLEIQLAKDWAKDDSRDKTSYTDAITAGKNYVANN